MCTCPKFCPIGNWVIGFFNTITSIDNANSLVQKQLVMQLVIDFFFKQQLPISAPGTLLPTRLIRAPVPQRAPHAAQPVGIQRHVHVQSAANAGHLTAQLPVLSVTCRPAAPRRQQSVAGQRQLDGRGQQQRQPGQGSTQEAQGLLLQQQQQQ